jgi:hypothetical protein
MTAVRGPSLDDVLNAFAVEENSGGQTLTRYIQKYPQYAENLVDLSREIHRTVLEDRGDLSNQDQARIEAAWQRHVQAVPTTAAVDPLAALSVSDIRQVAIDLGIKRQVLAAFREHRVIVNSIPPRFLNLLAAAVKVSAEHLKAALSVPLALSAARSWKADSGPQDGGPVTFERLLIDAGYSDKERAEFMTDEG